MRQKDNIIFYGAIGVIFCRFGEARYVRSTDRSGNHFKTSALRAPRFTGNIQDVVSFPAAAIHRHPYTFRKRASTIYIFLARGMPLLPLFTWRFPFLHSSDFPSRDVRNSRIYMWKSAA